MLLNILVMSTNNESIFISGNVPSSKNGKIWTGKRFIWSKACQKYTKNTREEWLKYRKKFIELSKGKEFPLVVEFQFIRGSKHKFDYPNPLQTVLDLMVKYSWISDDNADVIFPVFKTYSYDKGNPGVYIKILN